MTRFASDFIRGPIIAILITIAFVIPLKAQTGSVNLEGTVWDPSGDPLPGATLTAVEEDTGRQYETSTDNEGDYRLLALQPGAYTVTVKAKGFKDVIHRGILVFAPGSTYESFTFEVAAIDKDIAPGEYPRFFDSGTTFSLSRQNVENMPLLNRNPLELLIYQPGVQINGGNEDASSVNGTRLAMNTIRIDGISVTDPVDPRLISSDWPMNPDSISDLQIVTIGAKAEYGGSGGGQFILASRPGGKSWSGGFYDYLSNRILNANNFFNNSLNIPRPGLARNIFGVTASGPIGNKNQVFANYEGNRTDRQVIRNRLVLSPTAKEGVFQWYTPDDTVRDSTTVQSYDIAANDPRGLGIDPAVAALLERLPDPNNDFIGDGLNVQGYRFDNKTHTDQDRFNVRIDRSLNPKHHLFARFHWDKTDTTDVLNNADAPFEDEPSGIYAANNWGFVVGSDYTLNPRMVNELRVGYFRPKIDLERPARSSGPMLIVNSYTSPLDPSFPRSENIPTFEIMDNLSHSRRHHFFKYGLSFRRILQHSIDYNGVYPDITLGIDHGNAPSSSIGPSEHVDISATDRILFENIYNDLLGRVESVQQTFNSSLTSVLPAGTGRERSYATQEYAMFFQDNWRARPNLTINFGLRYEFTTVPEEKNGFQTILDQPVQVSDTANISNFSYVPSDSWFKRKMTNFAPRFGFAWDIFSSGKTLLRGFYGLHYDRLIGGALNVLDQNNSLLSQTAVSYPNINGSDIRISDSIVYPVEQQGPPNLQPEPTRAASVAILDPDLSTPRVHHFGISLEKRLFGTVMEIGYMGTRGKKLFQYLNLNQTKTNGDFLDAFQELQAYRTSGTPVSESNTLVNIFGSPLAAMNALEGANFDSGQAGLAADILDRNFYGSYAAAGVSDFYIRNFPQFDNFLFGSSSAESRFDSVQMGIRASTQYTHLRAYYTWSQSTDNISIDGASYVSPRDSFNPSINKTPSDFDRKHVFSLAYDYALPIGRNLYDDSGMPKWVDFLFAGWNVGMLATWESGQRFSVNSGLQTRYAGVSSYANLDEDANIDLLGNIIHYNGLVYYFGLDQLKLFTYPKAGEEGTSGRNSFIGPKYLNVDLMLHKKFRIGERQSVQFRMEAYNFFNKAHFALPNTNIYNTDFGIITSTTGTPRVIQLALRYQF